jgi:hypothetical protein
MSTEVLIGYSSNDFFYMKAEGQGVMPSDSACKILNASSDADWKTKCDLTSPSINSNIQACTNKALCDNKTYADKLYNLQNNNGGSNQRYLDIQKKYNDQVVNFYNLGIGITILFGFICVKYI